MKEKNSYDPIRLNPREVAAEKCASNPEFTVAYDALEDEFAALAALLEARAQAGLTQAEVAHRMGVSQPVLARIESSLGKQDHSPSLHTLRRYAKACGMALQIRMIKKDSCNATTEQAAQKKGHEEKCQKKSISSDTQVRSCKRSRNWAKAKATGNKPQP